MSYWRQWLAERFPDRHALSREEAKQLFWRHLPSSQLDEFFEFFEIEYSVSAGILRPTDDIRQLTLPICTKNPIRWFAVEPGLEDKASELNYQLVKRAKRAGLTDVLPVQTVGEYVSVWCGVDPAVTRGRQVS